MGVVFASAIFLRHLMEELDTPKFAQIFAYGKCLCIDNNCAPDLD